MKIYKWRRPVAKGTRFYAPDSSSVGYEATRDLLPGTSPMSTDMKAFGGADDPVSGEIVPEWLMKAVSAEMRKPDDHS